MAFLNPIRAAVFGDRSTTLLRGVFASFFAAFTKWNNTRLTRNALNKLSERELADIGLTPGDIDRMFG